MQEEQLLKQRQLLIKIANRLTIGINFSKSIKDVLTALGEYTLSGRIHILKKDVTDGTISCSYEWCNKGVSSKKNKLKNIPSAKLIPIRKMLNKREQLIVDDVKVFDKELHDLFKLSDVKSALAFPIGRGEMNMGMILFEEISDYRKWDKIEICFLEIITELITNTYIRKESEKIFFENEANLALLIGNNKDFIWSVDRNYRLVISNPVFVEKISPFYGKKIASGDLLIDLKKLDNNIFKSWKDNYDLVFKGETVTKEMRLKDNNTIVEHEVSCYPIFNHDKEVVGASCFGRDLTERRQSEQKIKETEKKLFLLINAMDDLVFSLSKDEIFQDSYQLVHDKKLYADPEDFIGKHHKKVLPKFISSRLSKAIGKINKTKESQMIQYLFKMEDQINWFEAKISPIYDEDMIDGYCMVVRDITKTKKNERVLRDRINELEELNGYVIEREIEIVEQRAEIKKLKGTLEKLENK